MLGILRRFNLRNPKNGKFAHGGKVLKRKTPKEAIKSHIKKHNPGGVAFGDGRKSKNVNIVPYARKGLSHTTVGVNSGLNVTSKRRASFGFYFRWERRGQHPLEKKLKQADRKVFEGIASKIAPKAYQGATADLLQSARRKAVNKTLGKQVKVVPVGKAGGYARLTTSRSGTPTITIRAGKSKIKDADRRKGIAEYNKAVSKLKQNKPKVVRAQRRKSNPLSGVRVA